MKKLTSLLFGVYASLTFASTGQYDFLAPFQVNFPHPRMETAPLKTAAVDPPLDIELKDYYKALKADGVVNIFLAVGAQFYSPSEHQSFYKMIEAMNTKQKLGLEKFTHNADYTDISYFDPKQSVTYKLHFDHERNAFKSAFAKYEVVMYMGHSRYGRGPAFENMDNYFRLGDVFQTMEVDAKNKYFIDEDIMLTDDFPLEEITLQGKQYVYQYKEQKDHTSELPKGTYVKNIVGGPEDFVENETLPGKQIYFLLSCQNVNYWKNTIRERFPDVNEKLVYGTTHDAGGELGSHVVFLASLVTETPRSLDVVKELDKVQNLFTAY